MTASDSRRGEPELFNSPLETGVRTLVVLNAAHPRAFDLGHLTWFDHLVVHTADVGGPASLHPDVPQRTGELLVRRRLIDGGISLMRRMHLIDVVADDAGIAYRASDEAPAFIELMRATYSRTLIDRAQWLADHILILTPKEIEQLIAERIGRWAVEFQGEGATEGRSP